MDHLGLDEAYRKSTRCTLYTLEMHIHFLHEVKGSTISRSLLPCWMPIEKEFMPASHLPAAAWPILLRQPT